MYIYNNSKGIFHGADACPNGAYSFSTETLLAPRLYVFLKSPQKGACTFASTCGEKETNNNTFPKYELYKYL